MHVRSSIVIIMFTAVGFWQEITGSPSSLCPGMTSRCTCIEEACPQKPVRYGLGQSSDIEVTRVRVH